MPDPASLSQTQQLLNDIQDGVPAARDALMRRCLPVLTRWARGRLPKYGRDLAETDDLVQISLVRAFNNIERFTAQREGAFLAYCRTILLSCVKDEVRRTQRTRQRLVLANSVQLSQAEGPDTIADVEELEAFEQAVDLLPEPKRSAVIMRVELGMDYADIAEELGRPSANSVRMLVQRALGELLQRESDR